MGITPGMSKIHGQGVIAIQHFKPGVIIEQAPLILLESTERDLLQHTILHGYYFLLDNAHTPVALALGLGSLYNHAIDPNASYSIHIKKQVLIVKAISPIIPGEEITINYHGTPGDSNSVYFAMN